MADDDAADKTEAPTPKRLNDAREEGNIARSPDLTGAAMLLAGVILLSHGWEGLAAAMRTLMERAVSAESLTGGSGDLPQLLTETLVAVAFALAPLMLGLMVVAIAANVVQVGFVLSSKKLTPDFNHVNPVTGFKRLFGGGRGPVHFLMGWAKLGGVGLVAYTAVHGRMGEIVSLQRLTAMQVFGFGATLMWDIALRIAVALLVLAVVDYAYQHWTTTKKLRMSKEEVKREMKEMDGDPLLKQRRRQIALQRAAQSVRRDVPTADVVVTNPTHFAVALKYDEGRMRAPRVVAKGADLLAQRIREVAAAHGVPTVERKPLARALYDTVPVGQEIPEDLYSAVAEILAYVYEINGRVKRPAAEGTS